VNQGLSSQTVWGHLEYLHRTAAHPVTTPAEDDGVDAPRQDPFQKDLTLFLVEEPADEEMHQAGRSYHEGADKPKESQ